MLVAEMLGDLTVEAYYRMGRVIAFLVVKCFFFFTPCGCCECLSNVECFFFFLAHGFRMRCVKVSNIEFNVTLNILLWTCGAWFVWFSCRI